MIAEHFSTNKKSWLIIGGLILLVGVFFLIKFVIVKEPTPIYCTLEVKICPDGLAVGRTGPKCEFSPCPEDGHDSWKTMTDKATKLSFQYPATLSTNYIHTVAWPPQIQIADKPFACLETGSEITEVGQTTKRLVDNRKYCVTKATEGAAGSIYTNYAYAFPNSQKTVIFTFTLQSVQCANYDDPQKTACESERESFDLDGVIDRMAQTIHGE